MWGLGVLLAWAGRGALLARWLLGAPRRADLGLCVGLGLCAMLIAGGVLNALRLCSPPLLVTLVVAGWLGLIPEFRGLRVGARALLGSLPLLLWGSLVVAGSLSWSFGKPTIQ